MKNLFRFLLLRSPSLRKLLTFVYRHSCSTAWFRSDRAINVDDSFAAMESFPSGEKASESKASGGAALEKEGLWSEATGWGEHVSIAPYAHITKGDNLRFAGQRVVVLAHWDPRGTIAPYVAYYAAHLRNLGFKVVLASGGPLNAGMADMSEWDAVVYRTCPGYDFTSWKAAFAVFPSLYEAREVFITNDSVFAPVGSFAPIFQTMEGVPCDAWGLVECAFRPSYLQSYGILFRERALSSPALAEFFARIPLSGERSIALSCEHRLGAWLYRNGLSLGAWLPSQALPWPWFNPLHRTWRQMIKIGLPLLKRDLFTHNRRFYHQNTWRRVLAQQGYPLSLITGYLDNLPAHARENRIGKMPWIRFCLRRGNTPFRATRKNYRKKCFKE